LGVGAFFGVVFLAIVKVFGANKGKGFETSKLGKAAKAIFAVLAVLIAGAATPVRRPLREDEERVEVGLDRARRGWTLFVGPPMMIQCIGRPNSHAGLAW
jgi:hypothetical protein